MITSNYSNISRISQVVLCLLISFSVSAYTGFAETEAVLHTQVDQTELIEEFASLPTIKQVECVLSAKSIATPVRAFTHRSFNYALKNSNSTLQQKYNWICASWLLHKSEKQYCIRHIFMSSSSDDSSLHSKA